MRGPGWVEILPPPHPKSPLVVFIPNVAWLFTPCHGERHTYAQSEAVAGARLEAVCSDCGRARRVELQADPAARAAASTAAGWVAQALAVCEQANLDGPVVLLTDTLICLVEDWGAQR